MCHLPNFKRQIAHAPYGGMLAPISVLARRPENLQKDCKAMLILQTPLALSENPPFYPASAAKTR
jgi:hypothetical protein